MANNYSNILLKLSENQVFSVSLHYQTKEKKHRLAFNAVVNSLAKGEHSLAELSEILVNQLVERFTCLQQRSIRWTHITLKFLSNYPNETYRINISSICGRLDGLPEERSAVRFELQESGTTQTRWVNLFGAPKSFAYSIPESNPELASSISYLEGIMLGKPVGNEKIKLVITPAYTSKPQQGFQVSKPLSCYCRGFHHFQPIERKPRKLTPSAKKVVRR